MRDLIDPEDGENRAVRAFLMHYGAPGLTVKQQRDNMRRAGWDGFWPAWTADVDGHLTKLGAQNWLRYLFDLERASGVTGRVKLTDEQIEATAREDAGGAEIDWTNEANLFATAPQRAAFRRGVKAALALGVKEAPAPGACNHPDQQGEPHGLVCVLGPVLPGTDGVTGTPALADQIAAMQSRFPETVITHSDNKRWWICGFEAARDQAAAMARAAGVTVPLTDEQVKDRAAKAGLRWIDPIPDDDGNDGYPGGFDMSSLDEIRALIAGVASDGGRP
jgi:hypothetical protein